MDIDELINELQEFCYNDNKGINEEKDIFNNYQIEFLTGFIGIIMNEYKSINKYEVYLNIKSTDNIACPLLYKEFYNVIDAKNYFEELKNLVNNSDEKNIANRCKIGL